MLIAVHRRQDQTVKKSTQAFSNKTAGELLGVAHHVHDVVILEKRETRAVRVYAGNGRNAQALHKVTFHNRRGLAHLSVRSMQINIAALVVTGYIGKHGFQVALGTVSHNVLLLLF